jgi:predicted alpha/beta-fold hydrolase
VEDAQAGTIRLSGLLHPRRGADAAVVIVHGLGGAPGRFYGARAAQAAARAGCASLELALRGADLSGEDFYHAGLVDDLEAALACPELEGYGDLFVLGYSLGGHLALHAAVRSTQSRLRAVVAVSAPIALAPVAEVLDSGSAWLYRRWILAGLREAYRAVARRRPVPTPPERLARVRRFREWDALTVVPRFGFRDVDDYYERASVGARLDCLARPALYVGSERDPVVPPRTVRPFLGGASAALEVRWLRDGGHVGFPRGAASPGGGGTGIESDVMDWLLSRRSR